MNSQSPHTQLQQFLAARRTQPHTGPHRPVDGGDLSNPDFRTDWKLTNIDPLASVDRDINPVDPWAWIETEPNGMDLGVAETVFAVSNGYLGLRGNPEEGRDSKNHGTFINGLHETWDIQHAEDAYGLARAGQGIVSAPDAKAMRLYIDDEPLRLGNAEVTEYQRSIDFREGILRRSLVWRTPGGKKVRVTSSRMVSFQERHLALMSLEIELLDADAAVAISSQILNRQDGEDEFPSADRGASAANDEHFDPRKGENFADRVFIPRYSHSAGQENATLGYQVNHSGMSVAVAMDHSLSVDNPGARAAEAQPLDFGAATADDADGLAGAGASAREGVEITSEVLEDVARVTYHLKGNKGMKLRLEKFVAYHSSRHVAPEELAFRCERTINRAKALGFANLEASQRKWLGRFWDRSDVVIKGQPHLQQAVRWNLFQLIQASARAEFNGVPAKGMTGSGYGGHYFWDTEIYVMPFLTYTNPAFARNALRFRYDMLPAAKQRALELSHDGALFPWRTINGLESSAYYAAGTAQYHIDADIAYALMKYVFATGDMDFLLRQGVYLLINTARFWMSLGFFDALSERFEIHSVTGPDEYTTVVNNNLYTNVMARFNLLAAADVVEQLRRERPKQFESVVHQEGVSEEELALWRTAAQKMHIPFNEKLGVNPQDDQFLQREVWDLDDPNGEPKRPLLLHYHPLTIYRYQVLKQADVVLALFLQGQEFSTEVKRANYDYYDRLTTGDSTLSAVVQSIMAAELGYSKRAMNFFLRGLFVDLGDLHGNTCDGVHIASCGGVWSALVNGFGGVRDHGGRLSVDPRLPKGWEELSFVITVRGVRLRVVVRDGEVTVQVVAAEVTPERIALSIMGHDVELVADPAGEHAAVTVEGETVLGEAGRRAR